MAISEQLYTNANLAFGGGHWSLDGASAKWRAGNAQKSSTAGDTCTITLPGGTNARALYLFTGLGGSPAATPGGEFTVTVDGVAVAGDYSCRSANWYSNQQAYRVAMPIYRGLADTNHTIVLTVSGTGTVWVDSILLITGAKATPAAAGNLTLMGDSVTNNATGASSAQLGYTSRLANLLNARLGRTIVSSIQGVTGDRLVGSTAALFGLTSRWVDQLIAGSYPELTAFQNGSNDLAGNGGQLPARIWPARLLSAGPDGRCAGRQQPGGDQPLQGGHVYAQLHIPDRDGIGAASPAIRLAQQAAAQQPR